MDSFDSELPEDLPCWYFTGSTYYRLNYGTTTRTDPTRQKYDLLPKKWYVEAEILCINCGQHFFFTVDEQKVWYETYRLNVWSLPRRCRGCRKNLALRQEYDALVGQAITGNDLELKRRVVSLISQMRFSGVSLPSKILDRCDVLVKQISRIERQG